MNNLPLLLGILFIGLKLSNNIAWSWWLVLLPLYGPVVRFIMATLILGILFKK